MIHDLVLALWFFLPAGAANLAPVLAVKAGVLKNFAKPIDSGKTWRGKRIFGDNKTWRGVISGFILATIAFGLQQGTVYFVPAVASYFSTIDYLTLPTILMGVVFTVGALGGDALASFFKRLVGIPSGRAWIPFDQLDYILGSIAITLPFVVLTLPQYIWAIVWWFAIHIIVSYIGYRLGFKQRPI